VRSNILPCIEITLLMHRDHVNTELFLRDLL